LSDLNLSTKVIDARESLQVPLHVVISGDEGDGWETVQRTSKSRGGAATARPGSGTVEEKMKRLSAGLERDHVAQQADFKRSVSAIAVNSATDVSAKTVCRTAQSLSNVSHTTTEDRDTSAMVHKNINGNSSSSLDAEGKVGSLEGSDKENLEGKGHQPFPGKLLLSQRDSNEASTTTDKEIISIRRSLAEQNSSLSRRQTCDALLLDNEKSSILLRGAKTNKLNYDVTSRQGLCN